MKETLKLTHHTGYTITQDKTFVDNDHRVGFIKMAERNGYKVQSLNDEHEHEKQIIRDIPDQYEH